MRLRKRRCRRTESGQRWIRSRPLESALREEDLTPSDGEIARGNVYAEPPDDSGAFDRALALAYRYLNRRARTVTETRAHLLGKGVDARMVERTVLALVAQGYLDDARFAQLFAQDKRALEQWGNERIMLVLRQRGVEPELIDEALSAPGDLDEQADGETPRDELDRARAVLRRRFAVPPRDRRERDRAIGILLRKGYEPDVVLEALASYARGDA